AFESKTERIDEFMTARASRLLRVNSETLAGGQVGIGIWGIIVDARRRGLDWLTEESLANENSALNRRRLVRVCQQRHEAWLRQKSVALCGNVNPSPAACRFLSVQAVKSSESIVHVDRVRTVEFRHLGLVAPKYTVGEEQQ